MANEKDPDRAIEACTQAIESFPEDAVAYFQRAYHRARKGDLEEALEDLNAALKLGLDEPEVYNFRSNLLDALGRDEEAAKDASRVVESGESFEALYNRGVIAFQQESISHWYQHVRHLTGGGNHHAITRSEDRTTKIA